MAIRNLRAIADRYTAGAVSPNCLGTWMVSTGYAEAGDAVFTGSISAQTLTVASVASGVLAVGSLILDAARLVLPGTLITALGSGQGGAGTYQVSKPQTVAQEALSATGAGTRVPTYDTIPDVSFQFQALSAQDLQHVSGLNLQETNQAVYINGFPQGVNRPEVKGGDIFLAPTGLTAAALDTWLVKQVIEAWTPDNWSKVACVLQMPAEDQ